MTSLTDPEHYDLSHLTPGERLRLWRRRRVGERGQLRGLSRAAAAERLGLDELALDRLERGRAAPGALAQHPAIASISAATMGELCYIARLRSRTRLDDACREYGVTRPTYHEHERLSAATLMRFWEERGFRFPAE